MLSAAAAGLEPEVHADGAEVMRVSAIAVFCYSSEGRRLRFDRVRARRGSSAGNSGKLEIGSTERRPGYLLTREKTKV